MLPRGAERPNGGFSYFRVAQKDQMEFFHASAWRGKTKKKIFHASAWRRKAKWRIFMLPRGAEKPNGDFSCFRVARKG